MLSRSTTRQAATKRKLRVFCLLRRLLVASANTNWYTSVALLQINIVVRMALHISLASYLLLFLSSADIGTNAFVRSPACSNARARSNSQRLQPMNAHLHLRRTRATCSSKLVLHLSSDESNPVTVENEENESSAQSDRPFKQYFATCVPGLENVLASELTALGAHNVETSGNAGVSFTNSPTDTFDIGLRSLLWLRTAHRVMELITSTMPTGLDQYDNGEQCYVYDSDELYNFIRSTVHVQSLLGNGRGGLLTLNVRATANGRLPKELCHTHYTSLQVKNALVDAVRDLRDDGTRPNVDLDDADVPLVVVLRGRDGKRADVSLYRVLHSGGSLHRRGYRGGDGADESGVVHKAALKESLGAGLLLEAGWDKLCGAAKEDGLPAILVDPMCGSATLPVEAALIAADIAPGLMRIRSQAKRGGDFNPHQTPPAIRWRDGDVDEWKSLLAEATTRAKAGLAWMKSDSSTYPGRKNCEIYANEYNSRAVELAYGCISKAGFSGSIEVNEGDCLDWDLGGESEESDRIPVEGRTIVVANPPWGKRLSEDIEQSWESLKTFLRRECNGVEAWILSGNKDLTRILRMKKTRSLVIKTGEEDLRWLQYHIFKKKDASLLDDSNSFDDSRSQRTSSDEAPRQSPRREGRQRSLELRAPHSTENEGGRMVSTVRSRKRPAPKVSAGSIATGKRVGPPTDPWD